MAKYRKFKQLCRTDEDWYPCDPPGHVTVSYTRNFKNGEGILQHHVSVWGGDDFGMERFFFGPDTRDEAEAVYHKLLGMSRITKAGLKALGFIFA